MPGGPSGRPGRVSGGLEGHRQPLLLHALDDIRELAAILRAELLEVTRDQIAGIGILLELSHAVAQLDPVKRQGTDRYEIVPGHYPPPTLQVHTAERK